MDGRDIGTQIATVEPAGDGFVFRETTVTGAGHQTTEVSLGPDLAMRSVRQRGEMGGQAMSIDVEYRGGRAVGQARVPGPDGMEDRTVDAAVPAGVVDDNTMIALLPGLPWTGGADFELPVFASGKNALITYRVRVSDLVTLDTDAGPLSAFRVEMDGGDVPMVVYLAASSPHEVLRLELRGSPMAVVRQGLFPAGPPAG